MLLLTLLVIDTSDRGVSVSTSVAVLSSGVASPGGTATVAVLVRLAVADGLMWTMKVYVMEAPGARLEIVSDNAPETLVWPSPVQLAELTPVGRGSLTDSAVTVEGPLLVT